MQLNLNPSHINKCERGCFIDMRKTIDIQMLVGKLTIEASCSVVDNSSLHPMIKIQSLLNMM